MQITAGNAPIEEQQPGKKSGQQPGEESGPQPLEQQAGKNLPRHLIGLPNAEWAFWRCMCLRGAGFPAATVLQLGASEELSQAAEEALQAAEEVATTRGQALKEVMSALDKLRQENQWSDKARRNALLKARDRLKAGEMPKASPEMEPLTAVASYGAARIRKDAAQAHLNRRLAAFTAETSEMLRCQAGSPLFREAVLWQSRSAVHSALDSLARKTPEDGGRTSRHRQNEELVASYIQRYCIKNDTIGFFGPVGWAHFVSGGPRIEVKPGAALVKNRKVYFETWPIEALASVMAREPEIYPWLAPIAMPFVRAAGTVLRHPVYGIVRITSLQSEIIRACDGRAKARELAQDFIHREKFQTEADFFNALQELAAKRIIYWGFHIPFEAHPENALREQLQQVENETARQRAMALLDELESARKGVEAAAGDNRVLDEKIEHLEHTFTRLTQVAAKRSEGKTYAGRTLVYEDCQRDAEVRLGPELLQELGTPMELLLSSARWLISEIAQTYREEFHKIYSDLARVTRRESIDAELFWVRAMPMLVEENLSLAEPVKQQFQAKWERILNIGERRETIRYTSSELRESVEREFTGRSQGWRVGSYHCPDVMIAGTQEEIQRGDYWLVLGELHLGGNTIAASLFVNQHPSPEELIRAMESDLGSPNVAPVIPKSPDRVARTSPALISESDYQLEYALDSFAKNRERALPISALVIEKKDGRLVARTRDGSFECDALDLVGGRFSDMALDLFQMLATRPHCPRIIIDRLVIKRESWRLKPAEIPFARETDAGQRFLLCRAWARQHGIPRFAFYKVPVERKPFYLDTNSPILLDIFCKMVRRTEEAGIPEATISISEMYPNTEQLWLNDAEGRKYTSELRMVAVDQMRAAAKPTVTSGASRGQAAPAPAQEELAPSIA